VGLCFECEEFPSDRVAGNAVIMERAKEYKELGREKWLQAAVEKAEQGFELHTAKYYRIWAKEYLPIQTQTKNEQ